MSTTTDVHTLSGAYALDALASDEAAEFRQHLDLCSSCRDEVRELRDAAARMGAIEHMQPPAELRARVLAAADRTPQVPPVVVALHGGARQGGRRRWDRLALVAAGVLLVGGGAVGLGQVLGDAEDPQLTAAEQVFEAEDAQEVDVSTVNGGELLVAVSPGRGEMAVDTSQLPRLQGDRVYQLWSVQGDAVASVGVIESPGEGAAMPMPEEGVLIALTIEPAGGSEQPTNKPIAQVDPRQV